MTRIRTLGLALALATVTTAAADDKKMAKLDPAKLVGTWTITAGYKDEDKMDADKIKGPVVFTKDTISLTATEKFEFKYTADPATTPAGIDMESTAPEAFKGAKAKGILALDGDTLKLCYEPTGGDRPKAFEPKKGSGLFSFVLKKAAK